MKPRVLVVDDRFENAYLLQALLTAKGMEVVMAANGQEALESAEKSAPDLIISDILMPVMDGFSLCRAVKKAEKLRAIPFIFYTATYTDPKDQDFALSLGADRFIIKPQDPEVLVSSILEELERTRERRAAPHSSPPEEVVYLQTYNRTLVRKLERKVQELEEANKALALKDFAIASAISGIVLMDSEGRLTYANPSFYRMWGYAKDEIKGAGLRELFKEPASAQQILDALRADGRWMGEIAARKKGGEPFTAQIAAHAVSGRDGETVCFMASCIDTSQEVRLRAELQRAQKLESLSLFAAGVAHDFNNLLTGMFNGLELVKDCLPKDSPAQAQFDMAVSVFERARDLTRRLMAFTKEGSPVRRKLRAADIVRESCVLSLSGSRISHTVASAEQTWLVEADANQLSQVFNNIILNARQAMDDKGSLNVLVENRTVKTGKAARSAAGTLSAGDYVVAAFHDSGPGIPEEILGRIFDPYFTTKKEGSGLGLVTSYAIVKSHGGQITVSSPAGGGACFEVWLPATRQGKEETAPQPAGRESPADGRILLMDDEPTIRTLAEHILTKAGYAVATAGDGREAVERYRKGMEEGAPFDLVILDLTVRGGMGGEEAMDQIRKLDNRAAAIASTGYSEESMKARVKERGFLGLLAKPYRAHELLAAVKAALGGVSRSGAA